MGVELKIGQQGSEWRGFEQCTVLLDQRWAHLQVNALRCCSSGVGTTLAVALGLQASNSARKKSEFCLTTCHHGGITTGPSQRSAYRECCPQPALPPCASPGRSSRRPACRAPPPGPAPPCPAEAYHRGVQMSILPHGPHLAVHTHPLAEKHRNRQAQGEERL